MKGLRNERGITGLETAIVLIAFVVVFSVFAFAALSSGLFSTESGAEAKTEERVTVNVGADPLVEGRTTFFTFPPAPARIDFTESVSIELGSLRFHISGDMYEIDWENGVIIFNIPLESEMEVELTYKVPVP